MLFWLDCYFEFGGGAGMMFDLSGGLECYFGWTAFLDVVGWLECYLVGWLEYYFDL